MYDCQTWRFWSFTDFVLSPIIYLFLLLIDLGFRLSNRTFSALVMRYSSKDGNVEFGDFILCAIRMKTMLGKGNNSVISHTFGWRGMLYLQWMDFQIVLLLGNNILIVIGKSYFNCFCISASFKNIDVENSGHAAFDLDSVSRK